MTDLIMFIWVGLMVTVSLVGTYKGDGMIGTQFLLMLLGVISIGISALVYS